MSGSNREIDGKDRTIRELLSARKYSIDYYQRKYKWQQKQVAELIDDLANKFLESHEEVRDRSAVAEYGHYFPGSIIISHKDGQKFIIDGQQRLTTISLVLILQSRFGILPESRKKFSYEATTVSKVQDQWRRMV